MWILWKMRFWKCEFCEKWDFENVNFVKNKTLKMWILCKMRFSKCEFLDFLPQSVRLGYVRWNFVCVISIYCSIFYSILEPKQVHIRWLMWSFTVIGRKVSLVVVCFSFIPSSHGCYYWNFLSPGSFFQLELEGHHPGIKAVTWVITALFPSNRPPTEKLTQNSNYQGNTWPEKLQSKNCSKMRKSWIFNWEL